jgi:hypothetical protein
MDMRICSLLRDLVHAQTQLLIHDLFGDVRLVREYECVCVCVCVRVCVCVELDLLWLGCSI